MESMVEKGWAEGQSRDAVRYLWREQMRSVGTETEQEADNA
jgi:hypothetical protein